MKKIINLLILCIFVIILTSCQMQIKLDTKFESVSDYENLFKTMSTNIYDEMKSDLITRVNDYIAENDDNATDIENLKTNLNSEFLEKTFVTTNGIKYLVERIYYDEDFGYSGVGEEATLNNYNFNVTISYLGGNYNYEDEVYKFQTADFSGAVNFDFDNLIYSSSWDTGINTVIWGLSSATFLYYGSNSNIYLNDVFNWGSLVDNGSILVTAMLMDNLQR
ncbi:MAG: hypothetical protein ACPKNR_13805 [Pleomorphochaeta sp.]